MDKAAAEDRYEALNALANAVNVFAGDEEVNEQAKLIGFVNGIGDVAERKFLLRRLQLVMSEPIHAPRKLREFLKEGFLGGPYKTSRQGKSLEVYHVRVDRIGEEQNRLMDLIGD